MLVELSKPDEELKLVRPQYEGPASRFERRSVDRFVPCGLGRLLTWGASLHERLAAVADQLCGLGAVAHV